MDQRWQNSITGTPADIDRYQYTYDQDSNRLIRTNTLNTALNETYTYDMLNRLTLASPVASFAQQWVLDATGNWSDFREGPGGGTLLQVRTANTVNEYTAITGTTTWTTPAYDDAGNTTSFPQPNNLSSAYTANRLCGIRALCSFCTALDEELLNTSAFVMELRGGRACYAERICRHLH